MPDIDIFKDIAEQLPQPVVLLNSLKQIVYANQQALILWPNCVLNETSFFEATPDSLKFSEEKIIKNVFQHKKEFSYIIVKQIHKSNLALFRVDAKPLIGSEFVLVVFQTLQLSSKIKDISDKGFLLKVLDATSNAILFFHLNEYNHPVILYANKAASKMYGYHFSEWSSLSMNKLWPAHSADAIQLRVQLKVLKTDEKWVYRTRHIGKNGVDFKVELKLVKIGTAPMNLFFIEIKSLEDGNITNNQLEVLRSVFDSSPDILIKCDKDLFVMEANQTACKYFAMPHTRMLGAPLIEVFGHSEFPALESYISQAQSGKRTQTELNLSLNNRSARILMQIFPETISGKVQNLIMVIRDITESYTMLKSVRESEYLYRMLFENSTIGIVLHRLDGSIVSANTEYCKMLGFNQSELHVKNVIDFHLPEERSYVKGRFSDLKHKQSLVIKIKLLRSDGEIIIASVYSRLVTINAEVLALATLQNITESIRTQEAYQDQKRLLELIIDSIPMQLFWKSDKLEFLGANKAFLQASGVKELNDILTKTDDVLVKDEALRKILFITDRTVLETRKPVLDIEIESKDRFGKQVIMSTNKFPVFDEQNKLIGILGIASDITERKAMLGQLIDIEKKFRLLTENAVDAVWALDADFKFVFNSKASEKLFGYTMEERQQRNIQIEDLYTKDSLALIKKVYEQRADEYLNDANSNRRLELELEAIHKEGHRFWVGISAGFYFDNQGNVIGIQGITRDITKEKNARLELIKAKEKAEESEKLKTAFLASISHELRTPLNAILGFSTLCSPNKPIEKLLAYCHNIHTSALQLQKIIESIFHLAFLKSNQVSTVLTEFSVRELILELKIYAQSEMSFLTKQLELFLDINLSKDIFIYSDRSKLLQLLTNLVNNAIKFTEKGSVSIGFDLYESEIVFYVRDTGMGIEADNFDFIFGRFTQIEINNFTASGAGLGLAIAKETADLLGGKIWLQSEINKGSVFYVRLPLGKNS